MVHCAVRTLQNVIRLVTSSLAPTTAVVLRPWPRRKPELGIETTVDLGRCPSGPTRRATTNHHLSVWSSRWRSVRLITFRIGTHARKQISSLLGFTQLWHRDYNRSRESAIRPNTTRYNNLSVWNSRWHSVRLITFRIGTNAREKDLSLLGFAQFRHRDYNRSRASAIRPNTTRYNNLSLWNSRWRSVRLITFRIGTDARKQILSLLGFAELCSRNAKPCARSGILHSHGNMLPERFSRWERTLESIDHEPDNTRRVTFYVRRSGMASIHFKNSTRF